MELIALWKVVKRRWWLIGLPPVVVLVLTLPALADAVNPSPSYEVRVRLTAAAPPDAASVVPNSAYEDTSYVVWLASEYVAVNLPHWITSDSFAEEVAKIEDPAIRGATEERLRRIRETGDRDLYL